MLCFRILKETGEADAETTEVPELLTLADEVKRLSSIKLEAKLKSTTLLLGTTGELRVGVTLANNSVQLHSLKNSERNEGRLLKMCAFMHKNNHCTLFHCDFW